MTLTALGLPVRRWQPADHEEWSGTSFRTATPVEDSPHIIGWIVEVEDGPDLRPFLYRRSVAVSTTGLLIAILVTVSLYLAGLTVAFMFAAEITLFLLAVACAMAGRYLLTRRDGRSRRFLS